VEAIQQGPPDGREEVLFPGGSPITASLGDVHAFLEGRVDLNRLETLLKGMALLDWPKTRKERKVHLKPGSRDPVPSAVYAILKLTHLSAPLIPKNGSAGIPIRLSPSISRLAASNRLLEAAKEATHRLESSGLPLLTKMTIPPIGDDALPLYLQAQGASLGKSGERLTITERAGKRAVRSVKLKDVSQVCLYGNVQITTSAIKELSARGVPLCHFSYGGWFHAMTLGLTHKNVELRIAQFTRAADAPRSLELAKRFIVGKIKNCRTMLRRHPSHQEKRDLDQLAELVQKAESASSAESLLGIEGMAAKTYFASFGRLLKGGKTFDIERRNRRPPKDPVNALLSFVYALLVKDLTIVLQAVGFDSMLGFYHRPRYGRPSLALDLAEEFRPLIGDSTVLMLINNCEVSESSFVTRAGAVAITDAGRRWPNALRCTGAIRTSALGKQMRIRHYGFLANRFREEKLALCRELLEVPTPDPEESASGENVSCEKEPASAICPACGQGPLEITRTFPTLWERIPASFPIRVWLPVSELCETCDTS
jgi:CRISPR-associated endonuclease Cas1